MKDKSDATYFLEQLDNFMKANKLNAMQFEKQAGLSNGAIGKWEEDKNLPSLINLIKLVKFMGVSLDDLIGIEKLVIQGNNFIYNDNSVTQEDTNKKTN